MENSLLNSLQLRCEPRPLYDKVDFVVFGYEGQKRWAAKPVEMEDIGDAPVGQPSFTLTKQNVQVIFDQLWAAGYRPNDGTGNTGHVEALKYHLEDMRSLVFERKHDG